MKLRRLAIITGFILASISLPLHAAGLMQVYYKALVSDPTFKKANSDWESAKENLPIARAAYLTQIAFTGSGQRQYANLTPPLAFPNPNGYNYLYKYNLSVTQPIFNLSAWDSIKSAHASVKAATATYSSAGQDLMVRTVKAYVAVLQAYDQLRFQLANKRAIYEQLVVAEQQFHVGIIAITGVYDARARYDQAVAASIQDQNSLLDAVEKLAEITGVHYSRLKGIDKMVPLVKPRPNNINTWTNVAMRQNYSLIAQTYSVIAARETIKQQSTAWLPQIDLAGQFSGIHSTKLGTGDFDPTTPAGLLGSGIPAITTTNVLYGLSVNFPLVQGGLVRAKTRQAEFNFLSASNQRELIYRTVVSDTRQSFLGIITGIAKIKADKASVVSAENALNATKAGYEVGTRNMVDVLNDVSALYQVQQQYADDQYNYIVDTVELKFNAGTLAVKDLQIINSWLKQYVKLKLGPAALRALEDKLPPIKKFPHMPNVHHKRKKKHWLAQHPSRNKKFVKQYGVLKQYPALKAPTSHHVPTSLALPAPTKTHPFARATRSTYQAKRKSKVETRVALPQPALQTKRKPTMKTKALRKPKVKMYVRHKMKSKVKMQAHQKTKPKVKIRAQKKQHRPIKKRIALSQPKTTVSVDEQVLPLYDAPASNDRSLPQPV